MADQALTPTTGTEPATSLAELALLFLRLGATAFGGPAAHIAMMEDEVVRRRGWLSEQRFLDLLGATNLIPGPNSTELAIHIGWERRRWAGLFVAGVSFILPAMLIVLVCAWVYVTYGNLPVAAGMLAGVKPVVLAVVVQAIWGLLGKAARTWQLRGLGAAALVGIFLGLNEVLLLVLTGVACVHLHRQRPHPSAALTLLPLTAPGVALPGAAAAGVVAPVTLGALFLLFLKIGSVLFGSGYVLLAFLRADMVERLGWLTEGQLIDAIAVGQVTPGPVFTTATFIGYLLLGVPGALVATVGIFLPSFFFVAASGPLIPRMRQSPWCGQFLDGVNVASLALMVAVTVQLAEAALLDLRSVGLLAASAVLLLRYRVNSTWLVVGGAALGWLGS